MASPKKAPIRHARTQPPPKATEVIRARVSGELKRQLTEVLNTHPHYQGNVSEFFNECARAIVLQSRKGESPAFPVEFVTDPKP